MQEKGEKGNDDGYCETSTTMTTTAVSITTTTSVALYITTAFITAITTTS